MTSARKLRFSPQSKGILNPQPAPRPWNKSRRGQRRKRQRKNSIPYKYVGVYLKDLPAFISIEIETHLKAKTIQNLKKDTVEVKVKSKNSTIFIEGLIVAHGGKYILSYLNQ